MFRVFTTKDLIVDLKGVLYGVVWTDGTTKTIKKLDKDIAYIIDEYVYPFNGDISNKKNKGVGIYVDKKGEYNLVVPETDEEKEIYSIKNIKELDPEMILKTIKEKADNYITQEQIDAINNSVDIYSPPIEPDDDILKKLIKTVIHQKQINPNNYKNKLDTKWSLTNLKSSLVKKQNLSMKNFVKWLDLLGCDIRFIVEDDGSDRLKPLKDPVELRLSDERFGGEEYDE